MARAGPSLRARQVRSTLTELLYRRYPRLYAERHLSTRQSVMPFGFEHDDGWFAIVDVLSGLLEPRGVVARQVKEKLGGLRYYYRGGDEEWCRGAAQVAIALSLKVCQFSGRHGRLMALGSLLMTIDPHAPRALLPDWITDVSVLQSRISYTEDRAREAAVRALAVQRDVPPGWTDLVNALLKVIHWNTVTGNPRDLAQSEWWHRGSVRHATGTARFGGRGVRRCYGEADPLRQRLYRPGRRRRSSAMAAATMRNIYASKAGQLFSADDLSPGRD